MRTGVGEAAAAPQYLGLHPVMALLFGRLFVRHLLSAENLSLRHPPLHPAGTLEIRRSDLQQGNTAGADRSALSACPAVQPAHIGPVVTRPASDALRTDPDPGSDDYRVRPGQKQPEIPQTAPVGVGLRIKRKIGIAGHPAAEFSALQDRRIPDFRPEHEKPHHRGVSGLLFRK